MTIEIQRGTVITVDRRASKTPSGQGLLKGLAVIWQHWVASFGRNDHYSKTQGTFTIEYPEERRQLAEGYRNMPILLYDDATGQELCTSCFQCQRICPPQVIHMTQEKDPVTGKAVPAVARFEIEYDACMSCGFCAEVCPFDAIKMDNVYELATSDHPALTIQKRELNRPVSYYERIAPTLWAEAKDNALKKLQGNVRRRSGLIGVAPQVAEMQVSAAEAQMVAAVSVPPRAPETPVPTDALSPDPPDDKAARLAAIRAAKQAAASPDLPDDKATRLAAIRAANAAKQAAASPDSSDDKAARLAAIRAANAAKQAAAAPVEVSDSASAPPASDDKAARLAAIRAANAAKQAAAAPVKALDSASAPPASDDKAARLAAIRAANAAKQAAAAPVEAPDSAPAPPASDDKAARLAAIRAANAAKRATKTTDTPDEAADA